MMKNIMVMISLVVMHFTTLAQSNSSLLFTTDSSTYWLLAGTMSWNEAQTESEALGGHLVTLNSPEENVAVFEAFHAAEGIQSEDGYFIGLFQNTNSSSYSEPGGGWEWILQGAPNYFNWRSNEPNSGGNNGVENCANVFGESQGVGFWNDCSCSIASLYAVAEVPAGSVVLGCTDSNACNYNAEANMDNGTCASCETLATACGVGTTWDVESGTCIVANPADINLDGCVQLNDLLDLLSAYGDCSVEESAWQCGDPLEYQGYDYETVQIGGQCWFAENCRYLPEVSHPDFGSEDDGLAHAYVRGYWGTDVGEISGTIPTDSIFVLYNGFAASNWNVCPSGWGLPSMAAFQELETAAASFGSISAVLRSETGWADSAGTNLTGFSAIGIGTRFDEGGFQGAGERAVFWTEDLEGTPLPYWEIRLDVDSPLSSEWASPDNGFAIRCVKAAD